MNYLSFVAQRQMDRCCAAFIGFDIAFKIAVSPDCHIFEFVSMQF